MSERRIRIEIEWQGKSKMTFLEFVDLPAFVTQREFLDACIEIVERIKKLGEDNDQA